jgi:phage tail sheath protein FI
LSDRIIPNSANPVYLTSGAAGTAIATTEAMDYWLSKFNSKPIRMLCYPESTSQTYQDRLLVYSNSRDDNPIIIITIAEDRTESQLKQIGQNYQKSDYQPGIIVANWLEKDDPFSNSVLAPDRTCPPGGHVMGAWIRCIQQNGIHCIPATDDIPIYGVKGVKGDFFEDDNDRTEIAEAGVNLIQEKQGVGIKIANFFTVSTATEYLFGNGILMRNYLKISAEDSLAKTENTPNVYNRITASRMALLTFMYTLWKRGSNGDVSEGETFGQSFNEDGTKTKATDHFEVTADLTNNPQSAINLGQRDIDIYFSYPSPAGSIFIGVGILLR